MKTGRNEPCPCGSGKKTKQCCGDRGHSPLRERRTGMVVAALVVVAAIAVIAATRDGSEPAVVAASSTATAPAAAPASPGASTPAGTPAGASQVATPGPQPPGPAPAGKVWSAEHGHWHDAPARSTPGQPSGNPWVSVESQKMTPVPTSGGNVLIPQPNTPVPEGKVWSPEHGHWHDAKTGLASQPAIPADVAAQMKKPGPPEDLKNYVWSEEHKHWHRKGEDGTHATAAIAPPPGSIAATATATSTAPANPPR